MKKVKGCGQPTWTMLKNAVTKSTQETIDDMCVKFMWACHESNLAPKTLKLIWKNFNKTVQLCQEKYVTVAEIRRQLKEEADIEILPYKDWGRG